MEFMAIDVVLLVILILFAQSISDSVYSVFSKIQFPFFFTGFLCCPVHCEIAYSSAMFFRYHLIHLKHSHKFPDMSNPGNMK